MVAGVRCCLGEAGEGASPSAGRRGTTTEVGRNPRAILASRGLCCYQSGEPFNAIEPNATNRLTGAAATSAADATARRTVKRIAR